MIIIVVMIIIVIAACSTVDHVAIYRTYVARLILGGYGDGIPLGPVEVEPLLEYAVDDRGAVAPAVHGDTDGHSARSINNRAFEGQG